MNSRPWMASWIIPTLVTALIIPLVVWFHLYPSHFVVAGFPHPEHLIPFTTGGLVGLIGWVWFEWRHQRDLLLKPYLYTQKQPSMLGWLVGWLLGCAGTVAIQSLGSATDLFSWLRENLGNGKLTYYVATLQFAVNITTRTWHVGNLERITSDKWQAVSIQWALFGFGFGLLGLGFPLLNESLSLLLLSWAVFFVIDRWDVLEHFVIFGENVLPSSYFWTLSVANCLVILASAGVLLEILPTYIPPDGPSLSPGFISMFYLLFPWMVGFLVLVLGGMSILTLHPLTRSKPSSQGNKPA